MQNTTADYKIEINKPSRSFECKITIGNNIYTNEDLVNLTLEYTQPQEGFSIGGTISKSLDLTLLNRGDIIYSTSQIKIEIGLKIGSTIEYILMGIFNIDDIEKTDYTTKFTAYDNMIKFETAYYSELGDKPTLKQVVNELSKITGVEFTGSLPDYNVSKLEGFPCREVLSYVASICCGNAFITRDGKFTIKTLSEVEKSIDGNNYFNYTREEVKYKVGQISCQVDENNILSKGSIGTDSMELGFENPWVTETILTEIYNKLNGLSYLGYSMKWQGDLSLDPYDIITVTDVKNVVRKIPILSQKITYTGGLTSEIGAKGETKNKNSFSSSGSTTNKVNRLVTEQAVIKEALIEKANIKDLEAVSIRTQTLEAKTAKIEEAIIDVAHIKDLNVINANIEKLIAADATINNALIGKADITELNAVKGTINSLDSKIANIETLVNGNLSSENIQAGGITSDKLTIANGFITNAMIASLDVSKINAGDISATKFRIVSYSGKMLIADNTIQIRDNNRVRVQIGKDASNDYSMYVWDSAGKLMFDATGLKADGIKNKIIRNDMISDNANIAGSKINISSLVTEINKDTNTTVIKSSKVQLDTVGQTLEVAFNSLKSNVDSKETRNLFIEKNTVDGYYSDDGFIEASSFRTSDYIEVNEGEIYTLCKFSADGYHRVVAFDKDKNRIGTRLVSKDITLKYTIPLNIKYIRISIEKTHKYKVEKGDNHNPIWISAPEDIESSIEAVKQITESNSTTINVMQGQIATAINNTQIVKDGQTILLKDDYNRTVAKVDSINSTIGTHTTKINELTGSITSVDTKVNSVQRDLEGTKSTVSSHTSQINGLNSTVSTQGASISQLKNQIALKVEATDITNAINNMNVGGENLFLNANFAKRYTNNSIGWDNSKNGTTFADSWSCYNGGVTNPSTGYHAHLYEKDGEWVARYVNESDKRWKAFSQGLSDYAKKQLVPGEKYTFSVDIYSENVGCYLHGGLHSYRKDGETRGFYSGSYGLQPIILNKWVRMSWTFTLDSDIDLSKDMAWFIYGYQGSVGTIYMKKPQLQRGTKATDFSISQEDNDKSIANVQTQVTTTSNKVATIETNLNSITQRVSSTESTVSTHTTQLGTVDSRINTAKSSAISTASSDATTKANNAQKNAINSAKTYTDGQITTVNKTITNKVAEIKATTDSIVSRVSSTETKISTLEATSEKILINNFSKSGNLKLWNAPSTTLRTSTAVSNYVDVNTSGNITVNSDYTEIDSTKTYKISLMVQNPSANGSGSWYFGIYAYDKDKKSIGVYINTGTSLNTNPYFHAEAKASKNTSWRTFESYIYSHNTTVDSNTPKGNCNNFMKFSPNTKYIIIRFLNYRSSPDYGNGTSGSIYFAHPTISEVDNRIANTETRLSSAEQKITPTAITTTISETITGGKGSISTTQFIMDKKGLTINNGALIIKNKAGTTVFNSDTNGNLIFTGTAKSIYGEQWVSLDAGGVTFQDHHKNEQMLRIGLSYFSNARDMNGVNFALAKYGDFIRFYHIAKTDLTNGWTSSDTQYNFFDCWSSDQTVDGVAFKKGINVYAPMYINNRVKFNYSGSTTYTNDIVSAGWNDISGLLGIYGDNGAILGYQNGSELQARIVVTEGAHPGTDDRIKSWGHWNCSGYVVHNATFRGAFQNSYANTLTRAFTETHCIEAENKQVRINFKDVQLVNRKAILNIPNKYNGICIDYIIASIVKKGKGDVWVAEEQENRFVIEGTEDIKVNIEIIINIEETSSYSLKSENDEQLCIDMANRSLGN
ncbi:hypothetical protein [Clostridium sp.]|uniref:hypothetical protein n=1 Tax=Clostridium sp. TaxID=1506 RepID=UPI00262C5630|nr:hypothetical protein [Clostridium sp.]